MTKHIIFIILLCKIYQYVTKVFKIAESSNISYIYLYIYFPDLLTVSLVIMCLSDIIFQDKHHKNVGIYESENQRAIHLYYIHIKKQFIIPILPVK